MAIKPIEGGVTLLQGLSGGRRHCEPRRRVDLAVHLPARYRRQEAATMFTTNKVAAAPILLSRQHLGSGPHERAVVANSSERWHVQWGTGLEEWAGHGGRRSKGSRS